MTTEYRKSTLLKGRHPDVSGTYYERKDIIRRQKLKLNLLSPNNPSPLIHRNRSCRLQDFSHQTAHSGSFSDVCILLAGNAHKLALQVEFAISITIRVCLPRVLQIDFTRRECKREEIQPSHLRRLISPDESKFKFTADSFLRVLRSYLFQSYFTKPQIPWESVEGGREYD